MIKVNVYLKDEFRYYELRFFGILVYQSKRVFDGWGDQYILY